jgi:hypothetical protein
MSKLSDLPKMTPDEKVHLPVLNNKVDPAEKIFLSGVAITENGTLTKHELFSFLKLDMHDYSDMEFTPEEAVKITQRLRKMSTGSTAMVPMICSPKCPYMNNCEFVKIGKMPLGRGCIWEVNLLREWQIAYINQYDVDPNNFTELGMINELVEIEVYSWRINQLLASDVHSGMLTDSVVGFLPPQSGGGPIHEKKISPLLDIKQMLSARKSRLIKLMVGDRQEKYKREAALKQRETEDPASQVALFRTQINALQEQLNKKQKAISAIDVTEQAKNAGVTSVVESIVTPEDLFK